jgi:hypothetical protein
MLQLLMEDGLLKGTRAIGPSTAARLGGARRAVHPAPVDPRCASAHPILDNIRPHIRLAIF